MYVIVHMQSFETHAIINSSGISGSFEIKFLEIYLKVDMIKVILQLLNNCLLIVNIKTTTDQHFLERGYLHIEVKFISKKSVHYLIISDINQMVTCVVVARLDRRCGNRDHFTTQNFSKDYYVMLNFMLLGMY